MKKWIVALLLSIGMITGLSIVTAPAATAAPSVTSVVSTQAVASPTVAAPKLIGSGGIKPAYSLNFCYIAIDWHRWCYQTNCTYFETVALGCRNNTWVRTTTYWWA